MSITRRHKRSRPDSVAAFGVIDLLRTRLSASAHIGPEAAHWGAADERRYQKQFGRPSALAASLTNHTPGELQHA